MNALGKEESGDVTTDALIIDRGELGKLGKSFNSMTAKIRVDIERLEALHKTAQELRSTMDLTDVQSITIQGIVRGMGFERVALLLVAQEGRP